MRNGSVGTSGNFCIDEGWVIPRCSKENGMHPLNSASLLSVVEYYSREWKTATRLYETAVRTYKDNNSEVREY